MAAKRKVHVPKLWRVSRAGKEIGAYRTTIKGERINLGTKDPDEAIRRRAKALKGERSFSDDTDAGAAATAIVNALDGTGDAKTPPVVEPPRPAASGLPAAVQPAPQGPPTHTAAAALPPIGAPPPPVAAQPDAYIPPPPDWTDTLKAAAAGASASSSAAAEDAAADEDEGGDFTPDELDAILDDAADQAVEWQLGAHAWVARKGWLGAKIQVAEVPKDSKARTVGKRIWKRCFKRLAAKLLPGLRMPDWIAAPVMVATLGIPVQFGEGAKAYQDPEETAPGAQAPAAAAA